MTERHRRSGHAAHGVRAAYEGSALEDDARTDGATPREARGPSASELSSRLRTRPADPDPIGGPGHWRTVEHLYRDSA